MGRKLLSPTKGRAALANPDNRFHLQTIDSIDDGWGGFQTPLADLRTHFYRDAARSMISYNTSPDVPFDRSINPYRGCEHGCVYCFARPTHAYLDLSPGLDFETQLFYKPDALTLLEKELANKRYRCETLALGVNTDAYQPGERKLKMTQQILQLLAEWRHPVSVITKSALIERDIALLATMAEQGLISVGVSITTLNSELARKMEPRANAPRRRLQLIENLHAAGIPVVVMLAPVIPFLNDHEMEAILTAAREKGASDAAYVFLRLPHEVKGLFQDWLEAHYPEKAGRVMNRIREAFGGREYQAKFGRRMTGQGPYADLLAQRFNLIYGKLGYRAIPSLRTDLFKAPGASFSSAQMDLFT